MESGGDAVSLDVTLYVAEGSAQLAGERIYVRRGGQTVEVTRSEWDEMFPGREPTTVLADPDDDGLVAAFSANMTHNLGKMASEVDFGDGWNLYDVLWGAEEHGWTKARDLADHLRDGLAILNSDAARLREFNPSNGWGDYDLLCRFTAGYLTACEKWPDADVYVSR